jgi:hypothetical protein
MEKEEKNDENNKENVSKKKKSRYVWKIETHENCMYIE